MKTMTFLTAQPLSVGQASPDITEILQPMPDGSNLGESMRHILLGSPGAVRQTIHLLHTLHYAETVLWSPIVPVEEQMIITPAQGEAMSLLRRLVR